MKAAEYAAPATFLQGLPVVNYIIYRTVYPIFHLAAVTASRVHDCSFSDSSILSSLCRALSTGLFIVFF